MKRIVVMAFLSCLLVACASPTWYYEYFLFKPAVTGKTQLETREVQNRTYDTKDRNLVSKAIINVLQDDGYDVKNLDTNIGFFNAEKEATRFIPPSRDSKGFSLKDTIEATVNVSELGNLTKVRASFTYKCNLLAGTSYLGNWNEQELVNTAIDDPQFYQDFFNKMDKAIFIEKQKL